MISSPTGLSSWIWAYGMASILASLLFPTLGTLLCIWAILHNQSSSETWASFAGKFAEQSLIETVRSWGKTIAWGLLFVFPGVYKMITYTFVPFVVALDPEYDNGTQDALARSTALVKKHSWQVLAVLFVFHILAPMLLTSSFDSYRTPWKTPVAAMALSFVDLLVFCIATQLLFRIFKKSTTEAL